MAKRGPAIQPGSAAVAGAAATPGVNAWRCKGDEPFFYLGVPAVAVVTWATLALASSPVPEWNAAVTPQPPTQGWSSDALSTSFAEEQRSFWATQAWLKASERARLRYAGAYDLLEEDGSEVALPRESDHDLRVLLDGGVTTGRGALGGDLTLGLWLDLDGLQGEPRSRSFASVRDGKDVWVDVFGLAVHYANATWLKSVKGGRLAADHGTTVLFDGAAVTLRPLWGASIPTGLRRAELFLFGGRTVHAYELDDNLFEDWLASAGIFVPLNKSLRLELDYRFMIDDASVRGMEHNYGTAVWLRYQDVLLSNFHLRGLNNTVARIGSSAAVTWELWDLGVDAELNFQPAKLGEFGEQDNPYFVILGQSKPHASWRLDAWKGLASRWAEWLLHVGWDGRRLLRGKTDPFNHSAGRLYASAEAFDLAVPGLYATAALEYHHGANLEQGMLTVGGAVGFQNDWLSAEVNSHYQRLRIVYYTDVDFREHVRSVEASLSLAPAGWLKAKASYLFERSGRDHHTVTLTLSHTISVPNP